MKNAILSVLFYFFLGVLVYGQEPGIAVNISYQETLYGRQFHKELLANIDSLHGDKYVIYDWDADNHSLSLSKDFPAEEKPVELAIFVKQYIAPLNIQALDLNFEVDTSGYITKAFYLVPFSGDYTIKVVNVKTGKVEAAAHRVQTVQESKLTRTADPKIFVDVKKYFGAKKSLKALQDRKNYRAFEELKEKIKKAYSKQIGARYRKMAGFHINSLHTIAKAIDKFYNNDVFSVEVPDINAKKIKFLTIKGGAAEGIKKRANFSIYSTMDIEGKKYPVYIADVFADEIGEHTTSGKKYGLSISAKKLAEKLRKYAAGGFFAAQSRIGVNKIISYPAGEKLNIALATTCMMCNYGIEDKMVRLTDVNLIERAAPELDQLRELYKDERFIAYNLDGFQDRQIGVKYLLSFAGSSLNITDVATGELISIDKKAGRINWMWPGFSNSQAWKMALLYNSDKKISFRRVAKQKRNKVKEIEIFNPFEFEASDRYDISVLKTEEVAGRKIDRKALIAKGYIRPNSDIPNLGILWISDGKAELFNAIERGEELIFTYSIKHD